MTLKLEGACCSFVRSFVRSDALTWVAKVVSQ